MRKTAHIPASPVHLSGPFAGWLASAAMLSSGATGFAQPAIEVVPVGCNAFHVASANVIGDEREEIICACYDGAITAVSADENRILWRHDTRAFPYDLAAEDIDGDGRAEVLVASADGRLYVIDGEGALLWSFESPAPLYQVAVARLKDETRILTGGVDRQLYQLDIRGRKLIATPFKRALRHIRTGDLTGDGVDESVVGFLDGVLLAHRPSSMEQLWRVNLQPISISSFSIWRPYAVRLADLDGDGRSEVLLGSSYLNHSGIRVLAPDGSLLWDAPEGFELRDGSLGAHSSPVPVKLAGLPGKQLVVVSGRRLFVVRADGKVLQVGESPQGFTNICTVSNGKTPEVVLASSPNGDDQVYRVRLDRPWQQAMPRMQREGVMARVGENIVRVHQQIREYRGTPPTTERYVQVITAGQVNTPKGALDHVRVVEHCRRRFSYDNLEFAINLTLHGNEPIPGFNTRGRERGPLAMSQEQLLDVVQACEKAGVSFLVSAGHGCTPFFKVETARKILEACPRTCLGFLTSEDMDHGERLQKFLDEFWYPVMDLCKRHGKKAVMAENCIWWVTVPSLERFSRLFDGQYADVLVMSVEDTASRAPELNLAGRLGLLLEGAVNTMSARTVHDEVTWNRLWQWECALTGHPFLRRQMVQSLLGARFFEYQLRQIEMSRPGGFSVNGEESVALILDMLGKGLLVPPSPKEMLGVAPFHFRLAKPVRAFLDDSANLLEVDKYRADPAERSAPFEGLAAYWGAAPVQPHYFGAIFFDQQRHMHQFIPRTPYGFVPIIPDRLRAKGWSSGKHSWVSDGWHIQTPEGRMSGKNAAGRIREEAKRLAKRLPVRVDGEVFAQVQHLATGRIRITLIDSGFLDPADRRAELRFSGRLEGVRLVDVLSGDEVPLKDQIAVVTVPAGIFRILELRVPAGD